MTPRSMLETITPCKRTSPPREGALVMLKEDLSCANVGQTFLQNLRTVEEFDEEDESLPYRLNPFTGADGIEDHEPWKSASDIVDIKPLRRVVFSAPQSSWVLAVGSDASSKSDVSNASVWRVWCSASMQDQNGAPELGGHISFSGKHLSAKWVA